MRRPLLAFALGFGLGLLFAVHASGQSAAGPAATKPAQLRPPLGGVAAPPLYQAAPPSAPRAPLTEEERRLMDEAHQLFQDQDWDRAAKAYDAIVRKNPKIGLAWHRLGYALHIQGKWDEAIAAHAKSAEFPNLRAVSKFNLGCAYALRGKKEFALGYLEDALDAGFQSLDKLENDPDLLSLRGEPRYQSLVQRLKSNVHGEKYGELNFWVGEWQVTDAKGQKLGASVVRKTEGGKLITESWTSAGGFTGTHFFYVDPGDKRWKLNWVDSSGDVKRACGAMKDGTLRFEGELVSSGDGKSVPFRGALQPQEDGRVKLTEELASDGKTWRVYAESYFAPMAPRSAKAEGDKPEK